MSELRQHSTPGRSLSWYRADEIEDCLAEAIAEWRREPTTSIWGSFWDRLTEGGPIPDQQVAEDGYRS